MEQGMSGDLSSESRGVRQCVNAARDAYASARDLTLHHHYGTGGVVAPGGPVVVGDVPQQARTRTDWS
jgi:hypothetical protein